MAANPLRKPEPKYEFETPAEQTREEAIRRDDAMRTEWPASAPNVDSSATSGWTGYFIGAGVLVLALLAVMPPSAMVHVAPQQHAHAFKLLHTQQTAGRE